MDEQLDPIGSSQARQVLVDALDEIALDEDLPEDHVVEEQYLVVVGASTIRGPDGKRYTVRHWNSTDHPNFVFVGLFHEVEFKMNHNNSHAGPEVEDEEDDD